MKMKNLILSLILLLPVVVCSCGDDDDDDLIGTWYRVSDFDGLARGFASSFTIGNKGYLVCGFDGGKTWMSDLWEYDMDQDFWTQKANFPGNPRDAAVAITIDDKGYLGTGYDGTDKYNDFWEYDPSTNSWEEKAPFPGSARYDAVGFGLPGKGYLGSGYDGNYLKDFYAYTPSTNTWEQIVSIGGSKRRGATSFVIDNIAYVCCGENNGEYISDFWKYDQSSAKWTQLRDIADTSDDDYDDDYSIVRKYGVAFVIDGAAYISCGESGSVRSDSWKYMPSTDLWENVAKFKGTARSATVSFSNGTRGYIATGKSSTYQFDDIWELHPYEYDDDEY
ncbi:kelch repeat-containing protein [Massilibacteroides sp.]|uniref:Kelch repeat-containing protein n=1 Tax=Massilibacteroides sp. TaxID=2034766 RepID=UPI002616A59B|nr:kelch repeat-containing protein [Massilibacteroides sp.]MDD4514535.1 kelch repeat-containing protein [Massilibacteroides sp.]